MVVRRLLLRLNTIISLSLISHWAIIVASASSVPLIADLSPYDEECFRIRTPKADQSLRLLAGDFELIAEAGGPPSADPLLVYIMEANAQEKIIWRSVGKQSGTFRVGVKGGGLSYWFCIQNSSHAPDSKADETEHPDHLRRLVGFSFTLTPFQEQKPAPVIFTPDHHWDWMEKSSLVHDELLALVHHHDYLRMRESQHRIVVEATFSGVLFWTMVEASLVIALAIGQVLYFRNFLEKKRSFIM
jgi:emp24/gp25L/p24 family/GOLD